MTCRCDRPIPLPDGYCLKCGRPTGAQAALACADRVRPLAEGLASALERLDIADYRAAFEQAAEPPPDLLSPPDETCES